MRNLVPLVLFLLAMCCCQQLCMAQTNGNVVLLSDYSHRGLSYDGDNGYAALSLDYQSHAGVYGGLWLARSLGEDDLYSRKEVDFWLGLNSRLSDRWILDSSLTRYTFPGSWLQNYDWTELAFTLHHDQALSVSIGINRNRFAQQKQGNFVEFVHRRALFDSMLLDVGLGRVDSELIDNPYYYFEMGVSRQFQHWQPRLAWITSNADDKYVYGIEAIQHQWLGSLRYIF